MKRNFTCALAFAALMMVTSCSEEYDDSAIMDRVESLEEWQETVDAEIQTLQGLVDALEKQKTVSQVNEVEDGYEIVFSDNESITISNGTSSEVAVQEVDGVYYWTINGEFITDEDGEMIRVTGEDGSNGSNGSSSSAVSPEVKDGYWYVGSYNTGYPALTAGDAISVVEGDGYVTITVGGTIITLPMDCGFEVVEGLTESTNSTYTIAQGVTEIPMVFKLPILTENIAAIQATITGDGVDQTTTTTRTDNTTWEISKPEIIDVDDELSIYDNCLISITKPQTETTPIVLKVVVINNDGEEFTHSYVIKVLGDVVSIVLTDTEAGSLTNMLVELLGIADVDNLTAEELADLKMITSIEIPEGAQFDATDIMLIGKMGIANLDLSNVTLPNNTIPAGTFQDNTSLVSIILPASAEVIEEYAFYGCTSLTFFELPASIVYVGEYAFGEYTVVKIENFATSTVVFEEGAVANLLVDGINADLFELCKSTLVAVEFFDAEFTVFGNVVNFQESLNVINGLVAGATDCEQLSTILTFLAEFDFDDLLGTKAAVETRAWYDSLIPTIEDLTSGLSGTEEEIKKGITDQLDAIEAAYPILGTVLDSIFTDEVINTAVQGVIDAQNLLVQEGYDDELESKSSELTALTEEQLVAEVSPGSGIDAFTTDGDIESMIETYCSDLGELYSNASEDAQTEFKTALNSALVSIRDGVYEEYQAELNEYVEYEDLSSLMGSIGSILGGDSEATDSFIEGLSEALMDSEYLDDILESMLNSGILEQDDVDDILENIEYLVANELKNEYIATAIASIESFTGTDLSALESELQNVSVEELEAFVTDLQTAIEGVDTGSAEDIQKFYTAISEVLLATDFDINSTVIETAFAEIAESLLAMAEDAVEEAATEIEAELKAYLQEKLEEILASDQVADGIEELKSNIEYICNLIGNYDGSEITELIDELNAEAASAGVFDGFDGYSSLTSVSGLPSTLKFIGSRAFAGTAITATEIPENVKVIGFEAYKGCASLAEVTCRSQYPALLMTTITLSEEATDLSGLGIDAAFNLPTSIATTDVFEGIASDAVLYVPANAVGYEAILFEIPTIDAETILAIDEVKAITDMIPGSAEYIETLIDSINAEIPDSKTIDTQWSAVFGDRIEVYQD